MTRDEARRLLEQLLDAHASARAGLRVQFAESAREVRERLLGELDAILAAADDAYRAFATEHARLGLGAPADPEKSLGEITGRELRRRVEAETRRDRQQFAEEMSRRFAWRYGCYECGQDWWADSPEPKCPSCGNDSRIERFERSAPDEQGGPR